MSQDEGDEREADDETGPGDEGGVSEDDSVPAHPPLDGMALDDAVEAVVAAGEDRDPEAVRAALAPVTEGAAVAEAVDDAGETRLDSLSERATGLCDWLDALADPAWRDRFGDRVTDFKATVGDRDPPIS